MLFINVPFLFFPQMADSPRLLVTIVARVLADGSFYFDCLSCAGSTHLDNEDEILEHMASHHINRLARYWVVNTNVYTMDYAEYLEMLNIEP